MSIREIHVNDVGTTIQLTIRDHSNATVDLSAGTTTSMFMIFKSPATTTTVTVTAFSGSGTSGVINWTSTSGFFNTAGTWFLQAKITLGSNTWFTDVYEFQVYPNL